MTIKQQGGIFGRNPTFNDVEVEGTLTASGTLSVPNDSISGDAIDGGTATPENITADGTINFAGATVSDLGSVTTADINGGTIDGTAIGNSARAVGKFTDGCLMFDSSGAIDETTNLTIRGLGAAGSSTQAINKISFSGTVGTEWAYVGLAHNDGYNQTNQKLRLWTTQSLGQIHFGTNGTHRLTINQSGHFYPNTDDSLDIGLISSRFDDIYATNGTIQTSDQNEKQDVAELTEAEKRVALVAKGLLRKYRWISAVQEKGDDARIHFGIIAQDLQAAFQSEGLDPGRYGMFIYGTWYVDADGELTDGPGDGITQHSRMGIRYSELLAFIIAAL